MAWLALVAVWVRNLVWLPAFVVCLGSDPRWMDVFFVALNDAGALYSEASMAMGTIGNDEHKDPNLG
ncbi:UNVERIFIED_CONTAM: hypothetical protein Sangu_0827500 [Sesamum angustifolium]|uniref:Uncharacterized protein n=1 Tax=Sesamum angustifolium TaxID=2727405 RepID=A0AAW2PWK4_9LAMI